MEAIDECTLHHFSHQHPLKCVILLSSAEIITCYGCNLNIFPGKDYYNCKTCNFSLHKVCANMPRKTRHPTHPHHFLTLYVLPESGNCNLKCKACDHHVDGFYYSCGMCNINFHILCAALPLSFAISSHPHKLKIEFSPPYNFVCDLCNKPSYKGWLYRCRFCEFDAHISCALSHRKAQAVPVPDTLTRQIIYSSASINEANRIIDYGNENNELMQLVVQGIARSNRTFYKSVAGWDERLSSPRETLKMAGEGNGKTNMDPLKATSPGPLGEVSIDQNPEATPVSEQDLTIPSYQFSDLCFSIDLLQSYSSLHEIKQQEDAIEEKTEIHKVALTSNQAIDDPKKELTNPLYQGQEKRTSKALILAPGYISSSKRFDQVIEKREKGHGGRSSMENQNSKSDTMNSTWSCCWRMIGCFNS